MAPRIWKISGFTLLAMFYIVTNSCSAVKVPPVDVKGYGLIKWGLTLEQVKALGPKAQILADPHSGAAIATVKLMVGDRKLGGYVNTDLHTPASQWSAPHLSGTESVPSTNVLHADGSGQQAVWRSVKRPLSVFRQELPMGIRVR